MADTEIFVAVAVWTNYGLCLVEHWLDIEIGKESIVSCPIGRVDCITWVRNSNCCRG